MGRYATAKEVIERYEALNGYGESLLNSAYLMYAENYIDERLGGSFTVPFSSNNITVKDLTIDVTFMRAANMKEAERTSFSNLIEKRIDNLILGKTRMTTSSLDTIESSINSGAYSSTETYHSVFSTLDIEDSSFDIDQLEDDADDRIY